MRTPLPTKELGEAQFHHQHSLSLTKSKDESLVRARDRDHSLLLKQEASQERNSLHCYRKVDPTSRNGKQCLSCLIPKELKEDTPFSWENVRAPVSINLKPKRLPGRGRDRHMPPAYALAGVEA